MMSLTVHPLGNRQDSEEKGRRECAKAAVGLLDDRLIVFFSCGFLPLLSFLFFYPRKWIKRSTTSWQTSRTGTSASAQSSTAPGTGYVLERCYVFDECSLLQKADGLLC